MKRTLTLIYGLGALSCAAPAYAVTPISGTLKVFTQAGLPMGDDRSITSQHRDVASWISAPTGLQVQASSQVTSGNNYVNTNGAARASWQSADHGSVLFRNYGWQFNVPLVSGFASIKELTEQPDWSYDFTAAQDSILSIKYQVVDTAGNPFGLDGWQINCNCQGSGGPTLNAMDPATIGTFTGILKAGHTYHLALEGGGNIGVSGLTRYAGFMDGDFNWSIVPGAPEPQSWAMMILGMGLVGVAMRRRPVALSGR